MQKNHDLSLAVLADFAAAAPDLPPCLIIEGNYNGGAATFYRVDFIRTWTDNGNVKQEFMPLLRNHLYRVNITKVSGAGFSTMAQALAAKGTNTNLTVVVENSNDDITDIVYNGQYYLGIEKDTMNEDKAAQTLDFAVETNYHQITFATTDAWIQNATPAGTLSTTPGTELGLKTMKIKLLENTTGAERTGTFTITAGALDLKRTIVIVQSDIQLIQTWWEDQYFAYRSDQSFPNTQYMEIMSPFDDWKIELIDDPADVVKEIVTQNGNMMGNAGQRTKVYFRFYGQQTTGNIPNSKFKVRVTTAGVVSAKATWEYELEGGLLLKDGANYYQFPNDNNGHNGAGYWFNSCPSGWGSKVQSTLSPDLIRRYLILNRKHVNASVYTGSLLPPNKINVVMAGDLGDAVTMFNGSSTFSLSVAAFSRAYFLSASFEPEYPHNLYIAKTLGKSGSDFAFYNINTVYSHTVVQNSYADVIRVSSSISGGGYRQITCMGTNAQPSWLRSDKTALPSLSTASRVFSYGTGGPNSTYNDLITWSYRCTKL